MNNKVFFSDDEQAKYAKYVKEIIVYNGEIIDGIQFIYSDEISGQTHGNSKSTCNKFLLEDNEYIINISWSTIQHQFYGGQVLNNISFKTNKNRKFEVNCGIKGFSETSYNYECKGTQEIIGLKGYVSEYFNAITHVIYRDVNIEYNDEKYYYDDYFSIINAKKLTKICGYSGLVIDKLQFVYDDNTEITKMHGDGCGEPFEFVLNSGEYIKKMVWQTAVIDFSDGYGKSPVLAQIEIYTNKERTFKTGYFGQSFEKLGNNVKDHIHIKHRYMHEANKDEEIFCLAGVYSKFMGRITKIYTRKIASRQTLSEQYINSDGKDILFVRNIMNENSIDDAVKGLVDIMTEYHNMSYLSKLNLGFDNNQKKRFAYFPSVGSKNAKISSEDFKKALLSGQYKYISIYSHGSEVSCGNIGEPLVDVKWVRDTASEIKKKLNNTIINFNCCKYTYRGNVQIKLYAGYEGLIREFIKAGLRAAFGYSISYLSISNYSKITDEYRKKAYRKIYNLIDDICIKNLDSTTPLELGEQVMKSMKNEIQKYEQAINPSNIFESILEKNGITYDNKNNKVTLANLATYLGSKIGGINEFKNIFTSDGFLMSSEGVGRLRQEVIKLFDFDKKIINCCVLKFQHI